MRTLTLEELIAHGACRDQVKLFKKHFKKSVVVTEELAASVSGVFDFLWASRQFLTSASKAKYEKVCVRAEAIYDKAGAVFLDEHDKACSQARAVYRKTCAAASTELEQVCESAQAEYEKVCAEALEKYRKVYAAAWKEYERVSAVTFAKFYSAEQT